MQLLVDAYAEANADPGVGYANAIIINFMSSIIT
jgi:hypothetical protein